MNILGNSRHYFCLLRYCSVAAYCNCGSSLCLTNIEFHIKHVFILVWVDHRHSDQNNLLFKNLFNFGLGYSRRAEMTTLQLSHIRSLYLFRQPISTKSELVEAVASFRASLMPFLERTEGLFPPTRKQIWISPP